MHKASMGEVTHVRSRKQGIRASKSAPTHTSASRLCFGATAAGVNLKERTGGARCDAILESALSCTGPADASCVGGIHGILSKRAVVSVRAESSVSMRVRAEIHTMRVWCVLDPIFSE